MQRDSHLRSVDLPGTGRAIAVIALALTTIAAPALAQDRQRIDLYGYVAPRCWVAPSRPIEPLANQPAPAAGAVCNQAVPRLQSQVRGLNADGTLRTRVVELGDMQAAADAPEQLSGRTALEIIVSPRI